MFSLYKTQTKPTGVSTSCIFNSYLVVGISSELSLYSIYNDSLHLYRRVSLMGVIESIHSSTHHLVICFTGGKVVVLDSNLTTLSLHYYHKLVRCTVTQDYAAIIWGDKLALLQISQKSSTKSYDITVKNVIDAVFMQDYLNPTIAILYHTELTNTTRLAKTNDTVAVTVISIDPATQTHATLFTKRGLPYNCYKIVQVPSPTGGILVIGPSAVLHLDQLGVCGAFVNGFWGWEKKGIHTGVYNPDSLNDYKEWCMELDEAACWFINPDTCIISNGVGELVQATLQGKEGVGSNWLRKKSGVRTILLKRLGIKTLQVDSACSIGMDFKDLKFEKPQYLFMGSKSSDSLLVKITHIHTSTIDEVVDANGDADDDLDDDLYMTEKKGPSVTLSTTFKLTICDSIPTLAPLRDTTVSTPALHNLYSEFPSTSNSQCRDLEMISCAGDSLIVTQNDIRPCILSSFDFPDVIDLWSVSVGGTCHYLVLGKKESSVIIKTGDEFNMLTRSDFLTDSATLWAGGFGNELVLQVYDGGAVLLDSAGKLLSNFEAVDFGVVANCCVQHPFVSLLLTNGNVLILISDSGTSVSLYGTIKDGGLTACSIYADANSKFGMGNAGSARPTSARKRSLGRKVSNTVGSGNLAAPRSSRYSYNEYSDLYRDDDVDEDMRYVEEEAAIIEDVVMDEDEDEAISNAVELAIWKDDAIAVSASYGGKEYFCVVTREVGDLEILQLPSLAQCFSVPRFDLLPDILLDNHHEQEDDSSQQFQNSRIVECLLLNLGATDDSKECYLFARNVANDFIIYKAEAFDNVVGRLSIRMNRFHHTHISRAHSTVKSSSSESEILFKQFIRPFACIGGDDGEASLVKKMSYSGVFLGGAKPCFVMMGGKSDEIFDQFDAATATPDSTEHLGLDLLDPPLPKTGKNYLRVHPFMRDTAVKAFAEFHNVNCPRGFVYFNSLGMLRICKLLTQFSYDSDSPFLKHKLGRTPHFLSYHYETAKIIMATSTPSPFILSKAKYAAALSAGVLDPDDEASKPQPELLEPGMFYPTISEYSLELVSSVTFETVDIFKLEEYEIVLAIQCVLLDFKQTASGNKLFLAVGTGTFRGEDLATRGRILLFDVIEVVPEVNNPQTNHKLKLVCQSEEKSPVTALSCTNGNLIAAIGTKVIIHSYDETDDLTGVAFLDVNLYVTSICVVKNLILVGDLLKSVSMLAYQQEPSKVTLIGKDFAALSVYAVNCIVDDGDMSFIVSDSEKNLHAMQYNPYNISSIGGSRLIRRGDINVGSQVQSMTRLRRIGEEGALSRQHFDVCASLDGRISLMTPVTEKTYKRLYALYSKMVNQMQHFAGLNPRGFRQAVVRVRPLVSNIVSGPPGAKMVLDGDLLYQFPFLPIRLQAELTKGSDATLVFDDLIELYEGMNYF